MKGDVLLKPSDALRRAKRLSGTIFSKMLLSYMAFILNQRPTVKDPLSKSGVCIILQGDRMLGRFESEGRLLLPDLAVVGSFVNDTHSLGQLDGRDSWFASVADAGTLPPAGWEWLETRALLSAFSASQLQAVSCARELHWWRERNRFCGCCGAPTIDVATERAKKCPQCNALFFPNASPAIIVAVTRGEQILLAHNRNFRPGMFSLLAGFVDPGETLEQAAVREVREEVGIEIGQLRYISSQPWPFPNSLMLGFRAQYVSGELLVDGKEIEQAGWFTRDALPEIPRLGTVARAIIDAWLKE
jgi:NAD+ diphosphatase